MTVEIALFQQSLNIYERIGNVQGKAVTLWSLGKLFVDEKGDFETDILYLQKSLDIYQRTGLPRAVTVQEMYDRVQAQAENR